MRILSRRFFISLIPVTIIAMTYAFIATSLDFSRGLFYALLFLIFVPMVIVCILYTETGIWNPKKAIESLPKIEDKDA